MIEEKAKQLQDLANARLPSSQELSCAFSSGWLERFKRRWELGALSPRPDDATNATVVGGEQWSSLLAEVSQYARRDVWSAGETALFYKMSPDKRVSVASLPGREKRADVITFLACCNSDGTEKADLHFIGKSRAPAAFCGKHGVEYGVNYTSNEKAWVTSSLFFHWLRSLDAKMSEESGRQILLLVEHCSAHGHADTLPAMDHVRVRYLPKVASRKLQPMKNGIFGDMKLRFRLLQMDRACDRADLSEEDYYKSDVLVAMRWLQHVWRDMKSLTISNCWRATGLLDGTGNISTIVNPEIEDILPQIERLRDAIVPTQRRISFLDILRDEDFFICTQVIEDTLLVNTIVEEVLQSAGQGDAEDDEVASTSSMSVKDKLKLIAYFKESFMADLNENALLRSSLRRMQESLRGK